ncbi:HNH endonuclease [Timonella senegalensis]|uniref:HNH endonuclease n=1 Tax=Timonella senegalensis TaxID=1465825 RepID=UPI0009DB68E0|nr:HNH endonuclease signature motif containing protein [Timonella senegalensis]
MATSRTGTTKWLKLRQQALRQAQRNNQTRCLECNIELNYQQGLQPNSAEPDHKIEWAKGGTDTLDNLRIICRRCNQKRGGQTGRRKQLANRKRQQTQSLQPKTVIQW